MLNFNRRPSRICVGCSHVAPIVLLKFTTLLSLSTLYRSTLACRRWLPPNRKILLARMSNWLMRGPYWVNGGTRLIVTVRTPPDNGRPSDGWICAVVNVVFAL